MNDAITVMTTLDKSEDADRLARLLVKERLAACIQTLGPISSTYRWQDRVETAQEWLLLIKTRADRWEELERVIRQHHPYDTPEILALPVSAGSPPYMQWIDEETAG